MKMYPRFGMFTEMTIEKGQVHVRSIKTREDGMLIVSFENHERQTWWVAISVEEAQRIGFIDFQKLECFAKPMESPTRTQITMEDYYKRL